MTVYKIETGQYFAVTYAVEADSPEQAWDALMFGDGYCLRLEPGEILGAFEAATIEVDDSVGRHR